MFEDLESIDVHDREYSARLGWVNVLVPVPYWSSTASLSLAVTDHTADDKVRLVQSEAVRVSV